MSIAGPTSGEGTFTGTVINNGTISVGGGTGTEFMAFAGPVSGSGSLVVGNNGGIAFEATDSAPIVFTGTTGLVNFEPGTIGFVGGISAGVISGFGVGDTLTFSGALFDTATYTPTAPGTRHRDADRGWRQRGHADGGRQLHRRHDAAHAA